jgi:hypothetical protein
MTTKQRKQNNTTTKTSKQHFVPNQDEKHQQKTKKNQKKLSLPLQSAAFLTTSSPQCHCLWHMPNTEASLLPRDLCCFCFCLCLSKKERTTPYLALIFISPVLNKFARQ